MKTRLYRSETDRMIGGVCGGLGQYLGLDPILVRLFFVLLALGNGIGVLIYLILWFIVPVETKAVSWASEETARDAAGEIAERGRQMGNDLRAGAGLAHPHAGMIAGVTLVVLGIIYLLQNLNIPWLDWFHADILWPVLLIVGGLVLLLRRVGGVTQ